MIELGGSSASVVNTRLSKEFLVNNVSAKAQVVNEDGVWGMFLPGLPLAADGTTLEEATIDLIDALREYAEDWEDHLRAAPNHRDNWALVQLIDSSTDEELDAWLTDSKK